MLTITNICVIICLDKSEQLKAKENLNSMALLENEHYFVMDYFFSELDININKIMQEKKIVLWGAGGMGALFMQSYADNYPELVIEEVVDSNVSIHGQDFFGYKIKSPNELSHDKDYYIIIAISECRYKDIEEQMEQYKLNETHVFFRKLLQPRPSELLGKTIYDKNQFNIQCHKINDFQTAPTGNLTKCCFSREMVLGNIFCDSVDEVWNSAYEKIFRLSLLNRTCTFCYRCDVGCPYLANREPEKEVEFQYKDYKTQYPNTLQLEMDSSCNLRCITCRDSLVMTEDGYFDIYSERIIREYLSKCSRLFLMGTGEIFVSKYAQKVIMSKECIRNGHITVLSNGLLFNEYNWEKFLSNYEKVDVAISIDAATKETYDKIRRNGNWELLNKNLAFIAKLKREGKIGFYQLNFVAQKMNVGELEKFVEFGKKYNVDKVQISRLDNWGFEDNRYVELSILDEKYVIKDEYKKYFENIVNDSIVDIQNFSNQIVGYYENPWVIW